MWLTNGVACRRGRHAGQDRRGRRLRLPEHDDAASSRRSPASASRAGLTIPGKIEKMGYKGVETTEMVLEGHRVPASAVLGGEAGRGKGFYQMMDGVEVGRVNVAARGCGIMRRAFELGIAYAQQRSDLRQADRRPPGDRVQARRDGHQGRGRPPDDGQRRPAEGRRQAQRRRGRHGQAHRLRVLPTRSTTESLPHPRRLRLLQGVRDRAALPRGAVPAHRRGHVGDPEDDHQPRPDEGLQQLAS